MNLAHAPVEMQLAAFERMVLSNPVIQAVIERMPRLDLPNCYLAAGARARRTEARRRRSGRFPTRVPVPGYAPA